MKRLDSYICHYAHCAVISLAFQRGFPPQCPVCKTAWTEETPPTHGPTIYKAGRKDFAAHVVDEQPYLPGMQPDSDEFEWVKP